jgi:hypothetical protein
MISHFKYQTFALHPQLLKTETFIKYFPCTILFNKISAKNTYFFGVIWYQIVKNTCRNDGYRYQCAGNDEQRPSSV